MKYYLAGPMTNRPQFNYPLFDSVADALRDEGYDITSPAEMDDPETRKAAMASPDGAVGSGVVNGETWGDFLARDVKMLADHLDAIILLPEWETSKGARLEAFVAINCDYPCFLYQGSGQIEEVEAISIMNEIRRGVQEAYNGK